MQPTVPPNLRRRSVLALLAGMAGGTASGFVDRLLPAHAEAGQPIVVNGQARAVVVLPDSADEQLVHSAAILVEYIQRASGALLPIIKASSAAPSSSTQTAHIYIGLTPPDSETTEFSLANLDGDGFLIKPTRGALTIIGPTSWGTRFGVYEFLERYLGVRWLLPGPDGDEVPAVRNIDIPAHSLESSPAYRSRVLAPLGTGNTWDSTDPKLRWAAFARCHSTVRYTHNLWAIFSPAVYGNPDLETYHPEFYPLRNGQHFIPTATQRTGWQPRFTAPGIARAAAEHIISYFNQNPSERSYAIGVNDLGGFSQDELDTEVVNSAGYPSASEPYYRFVNEVAALVSESHPNHTLGLIAYREVADPPDVRLHPNVIPFITRDRYGWVDGIARGLQQTESNRWAAHAETLGWYDYAYGSAYQIPRIYSSAMASAYQYGAEHGVRFQTSELYSNWGEGPKAWIYAKLLWNPHLDAKSLLNDWCVSAAGSQAAPELVAYFSLWERLWTDVIPHDPWFATGRHRIYFPFTGSDYLTAVTDADIQRARGHLEAALKKTVTEPQHARVTVLLRAFEYYEASALSYPKPIEVPRTQRQILALIRTTLDELSMRTELANRRLDLVKQYRTDPVLRHPTEPFSLGLVWTGHNPDIFWNIVDYLATAEPDGGPATIMLASYKRSPSTVAGRFAALVLRVAADEAPSVLVNGSFETGAADAPPWQLTASCTRSAAAALSGASSLRIEGPAGDAIQTIAVNPGLLASRVYYRCDPGSQSTGVATIRYIILDENQATLQVIAQPLRFLTDSAGEWKWIGTVEDIPETINDRVVGHVKVVVSIAGANPDSTVYFDNAVSYSEAR